jgi:hypothetical protein
MTSKTGNKAQLQAQELCEEDNGWVRVPNSM